MWPIRIDMNRDECRGMLRHLELEAYSTVMSTFRAQGMLNDKKKKLLDELRGVFHIPPDRHKAEARRVANDEKLCTIAEVTIGPNTSKEWWLEGKRSFPLLPRAIPYTAVTPVADAAAEAAGADNANLPHPQETKTDRVGVDGVNQKPVVLADPLKNQKPLLIVDRKFLKRPLPPTSPTPSTSSVSCETVPKKRGQLFQHLQKPVPAHIQIKDIYHTQSKTQSRHRKSQQPSTKKSNPKGRPPLHPKIPKKQLLLQQKQQQLLEQQQQQQYHDYNSPNTSAAGSIYNNFHNNSSNNKNYKTPFMNTTQLIHSYASPIPFADSDGGGSGRSIVYEMEDFDKDKAGPSQQRTPQAQMPSSKKHVAYNSTKMKLIDQEPIDLLLAAATGEFTRSDTISSNNATQVQVLNEIDTSSYAFVPNQPQESCTIPVNLISKLGSVQIANTGTKTFKFILPDNQKQLNKSAEKQQPGNSATVNIGDSGAGFSGGEVKFMESNILQKTLTGKFDGKQQSRAHKIIQMPTENMMPSIFSSFDDQQQLMITSPTRMAVTTVAAPTTSDSKVIFSTTNKLLSPQPKTHFSDSNPKMPSTSSAVLSQYPKSNNNNKVKMIQSSSGSGKIILNPHLVQQQQQQQVHHHQSSSSASSTPPHNKFPTAVATKISGIAQIKGLQTNIGGSGKYVHILPPKAQHKTAKSVVVMQKIIPTTTVTTPTTLVGSIGGQQHHSLPAKVTESVIGSGGNSSYPSQQFQSNIINLDDINQQPINVPFSSDLSSNNIVVLSVVQPEQDINVSSTNNLISSSSDNMEIEISDITNNESSLMLPSDASSMSALIEDAPIVFDNTPPIIQLPQQTHPSKLHGKPLMQSTPKQPNIVRAVTSTPVVVVATAAQPVDIVKNNTISISHLKLKPLTQAQLDNLSTGNNQRLKVAARQNNTKIHKNVVNYLKSGSHAQPVTVNNIKSAPTPKNIKIKSTAPVVALASTTTKKSVAIKMAKPVTTVRKPQQPQHKIEATAATMPIINLDDDEVVVTTPAPTATTTTAAAEISSKPVQRQSEDILLYKQLLKTNSPIKSTTDWESEVDFANNLTSKQTILIDKQNLSDDLLPSRPNVKVEKNELIEGPGMLLRLDCYANLNGEPLSSTPSTTSSFINSNNSSLAKLLNEPQKTFTEKSKGQKALEYLTTGPRTAPTARKVSTHHQKSHEKPAECFTEYTHTQLENILSGDGSPSHNTDLTVSSPLAKNNGQSQYMEIDEHTDPTAATTAATTRTTTTTAATAEATSYNEIIVQPGEKTYQTSDGGGEGIRYYELNDIDDEQMVSETFDFENFEGEVIDES